MQKSTTATINGSLLNNILLSFVIVNGKPTNFEQYP
jgi:hypothetical protein